MNPIPFKDYQNELHSLGNSPILGNQQTSQIPKPNFEQSRRNSISANSVAKRLSFGHMTPRKRIFSQSKLSPSEVEQTTKMTKNDTDQSELMEYLKCIKNDIGSVKTDIGSVKSDMANTEKRLGDKLESKFDELKDQMSEMKTKQETEVKARKELEVKVNDMQEQFNALHTKLDQNTNAEAIAEAMEAKIEEVVARQMKTKDNQINATYYQSLANELKNHEKDLMIYGFQTNGPDLEAQIRKNLFNDKLDLDIGQFKAVQVGSENGGKPKPIRVSFLSAETRNTVCRQSSKLPQNVKIEKCLPQRYRQKHREFRKYSWHLREGADVQTRVVF